MTANTGTYLDRIVVRTVADLAERRARVPEEMLAEEARGQAMPVSLEAALRAAPVGLIAEVKRASPSKGPIAPGADAAAVAGDDLDHRDGEQRRHRVVRAGLELQGGLDAAAEAGLAGAEHREHRRRVG